MDFQFLCARRMAETNHGSDFMMSAASGNSGGSALKLPSLSLVPPNAGLWFQQEGKGRGRPEEASPETGDKASSPSPASGWFPQQPQPPPPTQQPVASNVNNKEAMEPRKSQQQGSSGWFRSEPRGDSANVNVVSTNDSGQDDSDEEDEESAPVAHPPPTSNPATPNPQQTATPVMSPWFLAQQKSKENDKSASTIAGNNGPWFLGKNDAASGKHQENAGNKSSNQPNHDGPWYLGQHKIAVNPEHKQPNNKPSDDEEGPWFLGQTKSTEPRDPNKQNGLWFHASEIKLEQGSEDQAKRLEDASKAGCVWFGYNSLLKPDGENARGDLSKMMSWFGSGHMMRPDMVKQEERGGPGGTIPPGGFWFLPSSSAPNNCTSGAGGAGGGKMLECDQCQTPFRQRERLREHRRIHALGETPHTCPVCEKAFTTAAARECHTAVAHLNNAGHHGNCRFCDTGDHQNGHHMDHGNMHNHDGQQPPRRQGGGIRRPGGPGGYECKMCGLRFPDGPTLTEHVDHHPGGRPLLCRLCCKTFKSKLGLENHTRLHTGERPFECGECGARFPQRAALDYHVKGRHTGENHRTCGRCGKLFRSTPGYNNHMRLHAVRDTSSVNNNATAVAAAAAAAAAAVSAGSAGGSVNNLGSVLGTINTNKEYHQHH